MSRRDEFALIETIFAPLAAEEPGAFGLKNDAAFIPCAGHWVVTADCLVESVHFRAADPARLVAKKALRVNLSDLAAMGATPKGYLLTIALPAPPDEDWLRAFADGLAEDQETYAVVLYGGDTTRTPGPKTLSITALGEISGEACLQRGTAKAGDSIFLSGTLGDAALGLMVLRGQLTGLELGPAQSLSDRYLLPEPRMELGQRLLRDGLATAAMDVSDGLVADLGHIADASGLAAEVYAAPLPLSDAARLVVAGDPGLMGRVLSGGDDYELLFMADPANTAKINALSADLGLALTEIGRMTEGQGVTVLDRDGRAIGIDSPGWRHF